MVANIKDIIETYENLYEQIRLCEKRATEIFLDLNLDYSLAFVAGDGVMILDNVNALFGAISRDQLDRLSRIKTKKQARAVLSEIEFFC